MNEGVYNCGIEAARADELVSAARTSLGDTLRSLVYFTPGAYDVLYVRSDLYEDRETAYRAKAELVDMERVGFAEMPVRSSIARRGRRSELGDYEFTVRFHEEGFVVRVIRGYCGVLLTVDRMDVEAFEDAVTAIRAILAETTH
ncbi:DUF7522 family protein [Haloglomus litoreum]|uniref:DUF7522 family protein n=1 Tax=Haloglomus litoreum TaxID=3034026 RepID=UPI0023E76BA3|nr:hypothetical protein [Haloglomus sp. DT116]